MSRALRLGGALLLVLVAAGVWVAPAAEAVCPAGPWECPNQGFAQHRGRPGTGEHVVVVGDSLVQNLGPMLADRLAAAGFVGFTIGARGYAYWHWNHGVAQGLDIGDYVARERADHVILALGTNDARVLAADAVAEEHGAGRVTRRDDERQVLQGMNRARESVPGCVVLVLPTTRGYPRQQRLVRGELAALARGQNLRLGRTRFATVDWDAASHAHPDWFRRPGDVHFSPAGNEHYAAFLAAAADAARSGRYGC
jgi:hypothetical protein